MSKYGPTRELGMASLSGGDETTEKKATGPTHSKSPGSNPAWAISELFQEEG